VLASQADIARIARCATLAGVVIRSGAALDTSILRALTTITGDLVVGPTVGTHEVTLGELRVVEGAIRVANNGLLQGLFLPKLERAGRIDIDGNVAITTISLPRLAVIQGALHITDNASLEVVDIPMLESIAQELVLAGAPQLTLVDASQLKRAASVSVHAPRLPSELTDRLRAAATAP
jgi:LytS/YehU family sensor histidine kinase